MPPFDAELHLRLLGERELIQSDRARGRVGNGVVEAARALLAVGAIERPAAEAVADDYARAQALRSGHAMLLRRQAAQKHHQQTPVTPEVRRTVICNATIERPTERIHVRSVALSDSETRLSVAIDTVGAAPPRRQQQRVMAMHSMFSYPISDDRGTRTTTTMNGGGGNDRSWSGRLTTGTPLAVDAAWIELDGERIELIDRPSQCTVGVEVVAEQDPAAQYVWHMLASAGRHGPAPSLEPVLDALIAAGHLRADDPQVEAMRQTAARGHPRFGPPGAPVTGLDHAPPEWRSWLGRAPVGRSARGSIELGGVTPPFDGITVMASELTADETGWSIEVDVTPGISHHPMFDSSLDEKRVAWWAVDDLDQYYLGQIGRFSASHDSATGMIEFTPGIGRAARKLALLPSGPTERGRIEFPLEWVAPR